MGDKLPHRIPAGPAEQWRETARIRGNHEPHRFRVCAQRVFRPDPERVFSIRVDLSGENAVFCVEKQADRQPVDREGDRTRAGCGNPP